MTKIEIICGTYGHRPAGALHPVPVDRGGFCDVPEGEAERLVQLGVARIASGEVVPAVATPPVDEESTSADADLSGDENGSTDEESPHLDPEQLKELTNAKLTELAEDMGIDTAKLKTKAQLISAITSVPLEDAISEDEGVDDGEAPPTLEPEAPVV